MLAPVAPVDVLQHALAVAVREVEVDVGRLLPLFAQEACEQQPHPDRIHRRDAQAVADRGVGRRPPALAEDALAAGEAHDVPDDEEIAREPELADERQLHRQLLRAHPVHPIGAARRRGGREARCRAPSLARALLHQSREVLVGRHAGGERKGRQGGRELLEAEAAALGDLQRGAEPRVVVLPAPPHLRRALEVPLAARAQARAHLVECALVAQAGEHVVHDAPPRRGIVHVVGHHPRKVQRPRERDQPPDECPLLGQVVVPALDRDAPLEDVGERRQCLAGAVVVLARQALRHPAARTAGEGEEAAGVRGQRVERHGRPPARAVHARARHERREVAVPLARLGEEDEVRGTRDEGRGTRDEGRGTRDRRLQAVRRLVRRHVPHRHAEFDADDRIDARRARRLGEAHGASQVIVVGERECAMSQPPRALHQRLRRRRAVEEGEGGVAVEFGVGHWRGTRDEGRGTTTPQSYQPWTNQLGSAVARSWNRSSSRPLASHRQ